MISTIGKNSFILKNHVAKFKSGESGQKRNKNQKFSKLPLLYFLLDGFAKVFFSKEVGTRREIY